MEPEPLNQASTLNLNDDTREAADAVVWQRYIYKYIYDIYIYICIYIFTDMFIYMYYV
jgi:hypothetical protein